MSDLDVASNAAPETAAPAEQVIDNSPAQEAAPGPEAKQTPASSAREAVERAFREQAAREKAEKAQAMEPAPDAQPRDEQGKFAPKAQDAAQKPADGQVAQEQAKPEAQASQAPSRFAPAAKEAWANTPDPVKVEVERAFFEMEKGIKDYQARFEPLKQFDDMAKAAGKELPKVVAEYVNMENALRQNPVAGVQILCQRMGIDPQHLGDALMNGGQGQEAQPVPQQSPDALMRLEQRIAEMQQTFAQQQTMAQIDAFAKDHPRFEELSPMMAEMLQTGFARDLSDAYDKASRLQPPAPSPQQQTIAVPTAQPATVQAQTPPKIVAKQITGSPQAGSNPTTRKPAGSISEALRNAASQVGLA